MRVRPTAHAADGRSAPDGAPRRAPSGACGEWSAGRSLLLTRCQLQASAYQTGVQLYESLKDIGGGVVKITLLLLLSR